MKNQNKPTAAETLRLTSEQYAKQFDPRWRDEAIRDFEAGIMWHRNQSDGEVLGKLKELLKRARRYCPESLYDEISEIFKTIK